MRAIYCVGVSILAIVASPSAWSQTVQSQDSPAQTTPEEENRNQVPAADIVSEPQKPEEILVTGSRIRRTNTTTAAPIAVIDKDMIGERGLGRLSDTLSAMPQILPVIGDRGSSTDPRAGPARISLRGLGPGRTLVLLNGDRMDNDANVIPAPLIERIDVLTGGASAVYGSDAVAGVVNYIVKRRFTGIQLNFEASAQQSTNDNTFMLNLLDEAGYPKPPRHVFGGEAYFGSLAAGQNFAEGRGNISAFVTYNRLQPMEIGLFDHTACPVFQNPQPANGFQTNDKWSCGFNEANPYNWFWVNGGEYTNAKDGSRTWRPYDVDDIKRTPQKDWLQRDVRRANSGGFLSFDIAPTVKFDGSFLYSYDQSGGEVQFSDWFYSPDFQMPCDNPFMSAQQQHLACGADAGVHGKSVQMWMNVYRPDNTGQYRYATNTWRASGHLSGTLIDDLHFDVGLQRSKRVEKYTGTNIFDWGKNELFRRAMQVVSVNGVPTCQSVVDGTDPNCIPLDGFSAKGPNPAVWSYLTSTGESRVLQEQLVANASISGSLGRYGIKSPWAEDGIGVALVVEHRWNRITEQGSGAFAWWSKYEGNDVVDELGGELSVPIVQKKPLLEDLTVSGAYRLSRYRSLDDLVKTWKADIMYRPYAGLGFRASVNRAVRRGYLERLQGAAPYQSGFEDRCAAAAAPADGSPPRERLSFEQCAATGITRTQYDNLAAAGNCDSAGWCQTQFRPGGNPALKPETSTSITAGVVLQPKFLPGFNATVDYFSIKIDGAFEWVRTDLISDQCFNQHTAFFCGLITRDATTGRVTEINARYNNSGFLKTEGVDFSLYYPIHLSKRVFGKELGRLNLGLNGTFNLTNDRQFAPGTPVYSCLGYFGFFCRDLTPKYRHFANVSWNMPWKGTIGLSWRYAAPTVNAKLSPNPVLASKPDSGTTDTYPLIPRLAAQSQFDLSISYPLTQRVRIWFNTQNLFDKDPPIIGQGAKDTTAFQNTYPWYYNSWGRTLRAGISAKLW